MKLSERAGLAAANAPTKKAATGDLADEEEKDGQPGVAEDDDAAPGSEEPAKVDPIEDPSERGETTESEGTTDGS